jgi:phage baseplate assembly protein gpV
MSEHKTSTLNEGALHHVGKAYVVENMTRPTNVAKVYPIELLSDHTGKIPNKDDGNKKHGKVSPFKRQQFVEAVWGGGGDSHQVTSPYMRKGHQVDLYRLGTSDRYFWKGSHKELDIAKKDYALYAFSNLKDRTDDKKHVDKGDHTKVALEKGRGRKDATVFVVDQEKGFLELSTPNNDKEKSAFTYKVDMKKGHFNLGSSRGGALNIDAAKGIYDVKVKTINLKGDKITIKGSTIEVEGETSFKDKVTFNGEVMFNGTVEHMAHVTFNQMGEDVAGIKLK